MPRRELWLGGGEEPEWWGLRSPLKKNKSNSKKVTVPYTHSKTPFSGGSKLALLSQEINGPT